MANNGTSIYGQVMVSDCMAVLPTSLTDIKAICRNSHGLTNPYALNKPFICANQLLPVSEAQRRVADRGNLVRSFSNARDAAQAMIDGLEWTYLPPTGGMDAPYRLGDFQGYNHATPPWFDIKVDTDSKSEIRFTGFENISNLAEWFESFDFLNQPGQLSDVYYGFLLYRINSAGSVYSRALYLCMNALDMDDPDKQFRLSHKIANNAVGSYDFYVVPMIARVNGITGTLPQMVTGDIDAPLANQIWPLPCKPSLGAAPSKGAYVHIKSAAEQIEILRYISVELVEVLYVGTEPKYDGNFIKSFSCDVTITNTHSVTMSATVSFKSSSPVDGNKDITSWTGTLTPGASVTKRVSGSYTMLTEGKDENTATVDYEIKNGYPYTGSPLYGGSLYLEY